MKKTSNPSDVWSHPGFTYRQEGQCFVLTPDRLRQILHFLLTVIMVSLWVGFFGCIAYFGASLIQDAWLFAHGIYAPGQTINGKPPSQPGTPTLVAVIGTTFFLFGFSFAAAIIWVTAKDLCLRPRPSVLDRGRGEFRVGARVVCGLGDIARLQLRRGHNPEAPANLRNARYYASFVLRDGRQVPLASFHTPYFQKQPETELGNGVAGPQIEAVMQSAAAFLGVEYALTGGPDESLRPQRAGPM